tara:strand:- start:89 stop:445 length:357 start_codon:yes stop_codon:yes gene_type:complete
MFGVKKYWISPEVLEQQIADIVAIKKLIKHLIKENIDNEDAWSTDLLPLLFEYHVYTYQMVQFLTELFLGKKKYNPDLRKQEYLINESQSLYLKSHTSLLRIIDGDLKNKHGISVTIH